ncbi:aldehyde dehydrogenase [Natrarchaeobius halalkaliphilus]|uniref:Aldehyde dehydrogenase n=1 Tax=Natrarchaeobius halalkaliphilus TaxID=1679091 RepID=A0A3N6LIW1_9EURY|nr:aldehyde dehydrogenase family protein [Natrarchaeobius halalkaliphilus]RQG87926.1 aldehyde dehydrogenase [Natrarchaeobius halalkaliphilus]
MDIPNEWGLRIGGTEQFRSNTFEVANPATDERLSTVADASAEDATRAIETASTAFETWSEWDASERGRLLSRISERIRDDVDAIATLETLEVGRPLDHSRQRVEAAASFFEYYAGLADKIEGDTIDVPGDRLNYTIREPLGVTGHIIPWNSPILLGSRSIAPALVCGNTVVAKPSPEAPMTILRLAAICEEAGLPAGTINVVPDADAAAGKAITSDSRVAGVSFTGSPDGGKHVMKSAAEHVSHVDLELGGNTPCVVFPDADIEKVASEVVDCYHNAGQICYTISRFFVHGEVYSEFADALVQEIEALAIGPWTEEPDVGPVISAESQRRIDQYVTEAEENGARILAGGTVPRETGHFYEPTLVDGVSDSDSIVCDELFGPVKTLHEFSDEAEVVRRANDTVYGLYAVVYTKDIDRAHRLAGAMEAGAVAVNEFPLVFVQTPFGGYKESGIGRTKGRHAIENFTQVKNVTIGLE